MNNATMAQETAKRIKTITAVHGTAAAEAAAAGYGIPHCDCSRCCMVRLFRDQFDAAGRRK